MKIQTTLVRENPVPYIPRILYPRESKTHSLLEDGFFKNVIANDEKAMTNFLSQWRYCEINSLRSCLRNKNWITHCRKRYAMMSAGLSMVKFYL